MVVEISDELAANLIDEFYSETKRQLAEIHQLVRRLEQCQTDLTRLHHKLERLEHSGPAERGVPADESATPNPYANVD